MIESLPIFASLLGIAVLIWVVVSGLRVSRERYEYGTCRVEAQPGRVDFTNPARRNRQTGAVEFILWHKGERQGSYTHGQDLWYPMCDAHWDGFEPYSK